MNWRGGRSGEKDEAGPRDRKVGIHTKKNSVGQNESDYFTNE